MKKALAIVLCIIAVCFASCNKEKPNQKFIGNYSGEVTGLATISAYGANMTDTITMPLAMQINAGATDNKVVANCTIQEETRTLNGTVNENTVDFDPLTISYSEEGSSASIAIDLNGTLNGTALNVTGAISGNGTIVDDELPIPIPFTLTGTVNGTLNKILPE